jgi:hypothetical protein
MITLHFKGKSCNVSVEMQVLPLAGSTKLCPLPVPMKPFPTSRGSKKKNNKNKIMTLC